MTVEMLYLPLWDETTHTARGIYVNPNEVAAIMPLRDGYCGLVLSGGVAAIGGIALTLKGNAAELAAAVGRAVGDWLDEAKPMTDGG